MKSASLSHVFGDAADDVIDLSREKFDAERAAKRKATHKVVHGTRG